jgi:hypothetical protein
MSYICSTEQIAANPLLSRFCADAPAWREMRGNPRDCLCRII